MNIALIEPVSSQRGCLNRDTAGGFGTVTQVGSSLRGRLLEYVKQRGVRLPHLTLGYLAGIFKQAGHCVEYARGEVFGCDLALIASSIVDYKREIYTAGRIRKNNKSRIGFIGPFASARPKLFLPYCDFVIQGEPEEAALAIAGGDIPRGIIKSGFIKDLDRLPFPCWDMFPVREFSYFPSLRQRPFLTLITSRGCPFSCGYYCPYPLAQGSRWRLRSPANVLAEIIYLQERYRIKSLMFRDPLFTFDKARSVNIAEGLLKKGIRIRWGCETHLDYLDTEMLDLFYQSGLRTIETGIESIHQDGLSRIKRKTVFSGRQKMILGYCRKQKIKVSAFYLLGLPGETEDDIYQTIEYAKSLNTSGAQFALLTPYPGTPFYEDVKNRIDESDWEGFNGYTPLFNSGSLTAERLLQLKEYAFTTYYFRKSWLKNFIREMVNPC